MRRSKQQRSRRRMMPFLRKILIWNGSAFFLVALGLGIQQNFIGKIWNWSQNGIAFGTGLIGWKCTNLVIDGCNFLSQKDLEDAIQIKPNDPLFLIDINQIYLRLKQNPWIKSVCVKKIYPNTLYIYVEERKAYCCVLQKNKPVIIDRQGVVLYEGIVESHLPKVKGPAIHLYAHEILDCLSNKYPSVMSTTDYIERKRSGRFDLVLKDGTRIMLPQDKLDDALRKLTVILEKKWMKDTHTTLDLRVTDKIVFTNLKAIEPTAV